MAEPPTTLGLDWIRGIRDLGFPVVVALLLVWQNAVAIPAALDRLVERLDAQSRVDIERVRAQHEQAVALSQLVGRIDAVLSRPR